MKLVRVSFMKNVNHKNTIVQSATVGSQASPTPHGIVTFETIETSDVDGIPGVLLVGYDGTQTFVPSTNVTEMRIAPGQSAQPATPAPTKK